MGMPALVQRGLAKLCNRDEMSERSGMYVAHTGKENCRSFLESVVSPRFLQRNSEFSRPYALQSARQSSALPQAHTIAHGPRWTRREQIEIDGQMYDVCVTIRGDGYVGVWICRECGEHGAAALKSSTADQASTRAQIDLCNHHNFVHRGPRKPK